MRFCVLKAAKAQAVKLRQNYSQVGKLALFKQSRYAATAKRKQARQQTKKLRTFLGRVIRDIERKLTPISQPLQFLIERAKQIRRLDPRLFRDD